MLKTFFKKSAFAIFFIFFVPTICDAKTFSNNGSHLPILMYHYVEPLNGNEDKLRVKLTTTNDVFERQLQTLKENHYNSYFVSDVYRIYQHKEFDSHGVVLTFDDGYEDFYHYVFPLLKKYQFKATVYIIYDTINAKNYLTESEIREMYSSGLVQIGSHALDHVNLKFASKKQAKRQIFLSKKQLEARFKFKINSIAYPFGAFSHGTIDLVKEAKYDLALSTIPGDYQNNWNQFYLFRLRPQSLTGKSFINLIK